MKIAYDQNVDLLTLLSTGNSRKAIKVLTNDLQITSSVLHNQATCIYFSDIDSLLDVLRPAASIPFIFKSKTSSTILKVV